MRSAYSTLMRTAARIPRSSRMSEESSSLRWPIHRIHHLLFEGIIKNYSIGPFHCRFQYLPPEAPTALQVLVLFTSFRLDVITQARFLCLSLWQPMVLLEGASSTLILLVSAFYV